MVHLLPFCRELCTEFSYFDRYFPNIYDINKGIYQHWLILVLVVSLV